MTSSALTVADAARIMREAKDKSYQLFPLGAEWAEFLRAKRLAGCRPNTLESYETVGDKFARHFADFTSLAPFEQQPELVLDFLEATWPDVDPDTLDQRFAVTGSFFAWAYRTDRIGRDPMGRLERPKRKGTKRAKRARVPQEQVEMLLARSSDRLRDQCGLLLLARLALRREDLRLLQLKDINVVTDTLELRHAKGGKEHILPLAFRDVRDSLYLHLQERGGGPDHYLIYPKTMPAQPLSRAGIDQWFKRCLSMAGMVGFTMHQLRHAAIDEVRRKTGDVYLASELARHENLQTTDAYLHSDLSELRLKLEAMETEAVEA